MKVLIVAGELADRAAEIREGWLSQAPADEVTVFRVPETAADAVGTLGLTDVSREPASEILDALGTGRTVVVSDRNLHDGGASLIWAARERWGGLEAARRAIAGTRFLCEDAAALRGLRGAGALRAASIGDEAALAEDRRAGEFADVIEKEIARLDLVNGRPMRWSLEPYSGAGGGVGFALLALGGSAQHVRDGCAEITGLAGHVAASDLVVVVLNTLGVEELTASLATAVADAAIENAVPVVVVVREDHTSRRQRANLGIVGTYSYGDELNTVKARAQRIARTWSVSG
ncbi:MAG: glycerate kinase [Ruaniaceae bacterium]|nr:glycerate kinase [Ruaniaceae bacterium]